MVSMFIRQIAAYSAGLQNARMLTLVSSVSRDFESATAAVWRRLLLFMRVGRLSFTRALFAF